MKIETKIYSSSETRSPDVSSHVRSNNKSIVKIFVISLALALTYNLISPLFLRESTAYAAGDLTIDWGVPSGDPIFTVAGMMPGDVESRSVLVTNNATIVRSVAVRGVPTDDADGMSQVVDFVISADGLDIYGGTTGTKTLAQFFIDSTDPDGLALSNLNPSLSETYTFKATFDINAGNEYQGAMVIFDLQIGVSSNIPQECIDAGIVIENIIFGTENNDNITGTNDNDLIFGLEGNDKINGSNGDDCIVGGSGNDKLNGSNGRDIVLGQEDNDVVDGSNGLDLSYGGPGNDKMVGTNGVDNIFAGDGDDIINASNGNDYVIAGPGNDTIDAGNGIDYVEGNEGNDTLNGRNHNDTLLGGPDIDKADGGLGTDICTAETLISCES